MESVGTVLYRCMGDICVRLAVLAILKEDLCRSGASVRCGAIYERWDEEDNTRNNKPGGLDLSRSDVSGKRLHYQHVLHYSAFDLLRFASTRTRG